MVNRSAIPANLYDDNNNNGNGTHEVDLNTWDGSHYSQPDVGTHDDPSKTPTSGYNNSAPTSTPLNVPSTDDYTSWNWEQILNGVLGLSLPSRNQITDLRWTVTDSNMSEDHSLFKIFGAAWDGNKDFLVYLNPDILDSSGPWDEFYNTPSNQLSSAIAGNAGFPGVLDPKDFASASVAVNGVQSFYANAAATFSNIDAGLNSEASEFQGQAGQAFYQLTSNLNTAAQSILSQMAPSSGASYASTIGDAGINAANFVVGLYNALCAWITQRLDWSPVGAIFQALLDQGVVVNNGGSYSVVNVLQNGFGNLLTDEAWLQVESAAKNLWNAAVASSLDEVAQPLLSAMATAFLNVSTLDQPLQAPALTGTNASSGLNLPGDAGLNTPVAGLGAGAGLNTPMSALGSPGAGAGLNTPVSALANPGVGAGLNTPMSALGSPGAGAGLNTPVSALANPGVGAGLNTPVTALGNPGAGLGAPAVGLGNVGAGLNTPAALDGQNPNAIAPLSDQLGNPSPVPSTLAANPNTLADALGTTPAAASALQSALGNSKAEQQQLQKALKLAPSSGPLHNALENALAANGAQQSALQNALAGNTPPGEALGDALADNGKVQSALGSALNSGQVPASGPLRTALNQAKADNTAARTAAEHGLSAAVPGGGALQKALAGNGRAESALHQALASGQIPRTGPLHDTLTRAMTDVGQARHSLDQALQGGGNEPSSIQHALTENRAAQTQLQRALAQAPKTGPLHNELESALADTRQTGNALHQALTTAGVPAEMGRIDNSPAAGLGDLTPQLSGGNGLVSRLGDPSSLSAGLGGASGLARGFGGASAPAMAGANGVAGVNGLSGGTAAAAPGQLAATPAASGGDASAVPFFPPMAGGGGAGMGMGGQQGGSQERERSTWLAEDEDVWGTDPETTPHVLGRDFADNEDELDAYEEYTEPEPEQRGAPSRARGR
jgi:hypothetical protein